LFDQQSWFLVIFHQHRLLLSAARQMFGYPICGMKETETLEQVCVICYAPTKSKLYDRFAVYRTKVCNNFLQSYQGIAERFANLAHLTLRPRRIDCGIHDFSGQRKIF
jgi:hypothetical protein